MDSTHTLTRHDVSQGVVRDAAQRHPVRDRGQAAILVVTISAVLAVVMLAALATMGRTSIDHVRAQSAADAAALASLDGDRMAAQRLANAYGATLEAWATGPGPHEVTVTVRIGDTTAIARASNAP